MHRRKYEVTCENITFDIAYLIFNANINGKIDYITSKAGHLLFIIINKYRIDLKLLIIIRWRRI